MYCVSASICFSKKHIPKESKEEGLPGETEEPAPVHPDQKELSVLGKQCIASGVGGLSG